jgi:hypothetical protein
MNSPTEYLEKTCIRARRTPLLWSLALVVLALAGGQAEALGWWRHGMLFGACACVFSLALLVRWFAAGRRLNATSLARRYDEKWKLSSRLETSVELAADASALAAAQRRDAAERMESKPTPHELSWLSALGILALAALFFFGELAVANWRPLVAPPAAVLPQATTAEIVPTISWRTPKSEIKATAIEEVPLTAIADSGSGFQKMTLEVAVNGEPRRSLPLEATLLAKAARPGAQQLELSLFMDEVGAQEFDMVSYHLVAETRPGAPKILSPLQFVQVRPSREDRMRGEGASAGSPFVEMLRQLKAVQLQLLKDNFLLAGAQLPKTDKDWRETNERVANDQKTLAGKTTEFRNLGIGEGFPTIAIDNLGRAVPLMETAAREIAATNNTPAARPQGQALALITEIEKILTQTLGGEGETNTPDAFSDDQRYEMPPRPETPAGRLEELARKQEELSRSLDANPPPEAGMKQNELARAIEALAKERGVNEAAQAAVERAARDAAEAGRQLAQSDVSAARSPAAAAAASLKEAVDAQERAGRLAAQAELEATRRDLNEAAQESSAEARTKALAREVAELRRAAQAQQQAGSAEAARQFEELATQASKAAGSQSGSDSAQIGELARAAARAQADLATREEALSRAERQAARAAAGLGEPSGDPQQRALMEAELAGQLSEAVLGDETGRMLAQQLTTAASSAMRANPAGGNSPVPPEIHETLHKLVVALAAARSIGERDEIVRRFNPDDFDPAYRAAIETYFERLSREAARP